MTEPSTTDGVIAAMLVENTGTHFLDSGGAYGRSWQRNQAAAGDDPVSYFMAQPEAWQGWRGEEWATISVFHFLRQRVEYDRATDHAWRLWCYMDDSDRWSDDHKFTNSYGTIERWLDEMVKKGWARRGEWGGGYTYNDENALSQDFQWLPFELTDECPWNDWDRGMVAISIHGGCDARGGFTDFRIFECDGYDGIVSLLSYGDYSVAWQCDKHVDPNQLTLEGVPPETGEHAYYQDVRSGYTEGWYVDGCDQDEPEQLDADEFAPDDPYGLARRCHCGAVLTVTGWYAPCAS